MVPGPERPALKARYAKKRAMVIERAAEEFARNGFDATSIERLSEATELTTGGLYHYIGSKDDLLFEILNQMTGPLLVGATEIETGPGTPVGRLRQLLRVWVNHIAEHHFHMLVFSQERHVVERDRLRWERVRESRREFERILADLLRSASRQAGFEPRDGRLMALALLGMVNHAPQWMSDGGRLSPDEIADGFLEILFEGADLPGGWLDELSEPS